VDAGMRAGMGHLRRCLILANEARKRQMPVEFLLYGDSGAAKHVIGEGFSCKHREAISLQSQLKDSSIPVSGQGVGMVMDCLTADNLADPEALSVYLEFWHERVEKLLFIDGGMPMALRSVINTPRIDLLVAPYVGEQPVLNADYKSLCGSAYYPLAKSFASTVFSDVPETASRILVTCGGSDISNLTPLVLQGLEMVGQNLEIRVVTGPLFRDSLICELRALVSAMTHEVQIEYDPDNMAALMNWADMAIATSGLTKYELAATGTPSILISIDEDHELVNRQFLKAGTAISLGVSNSLTAHCVRDAVTELAADRKQRKSMSEAGQFLIDGKGSERIFDFMVSN
jgi:UDP-2,4-diacetamido-2,4,6-trideoxy-beta-L-altropyranose hydrolase